MIDLHKVSTALLAAKILLVVREAPDGLTKKEIDAAVAQFPKEGPKAEQAQRLAEELLSDGFSSHRWGFDADGGYA